MLSFNWMYLLCSFSVFVDCANGIVNLHINSTNRWLFSCIRVLQVYLCVIVDIIVQIIFFLCLYLFFVYLFVYRGIWLWTGALFYQLVKNNAFAQLGSSWQHTDTKTSSSTCHRQRRLSHCNNKVERFDWYDRLE